MNIEDLKGVLWRDLVCIIKDALDQAGTKILCEKTSNSHFLTVDMLTQLRGQNKVTEKLNLVKKKKEVVISHENWNTL